MPDDTKKRPATLEEIEAAYHHAQRRAPAVPLHVHADRGIIPGVAMRGTGPGGDFTAEDTHSRLTHGQYEAGLQAGIFSRITPDPKDEVPAPPPKDGDGPPARRRGHGPAPAQKEGEA